MNEELHPSSTPEGERVERAGGEPRLDPRATVLVVEDEHELRDLIAQWLERKGYSAVQAADGQDAVELLQAGLEPDVILLDLTMPRMDGWTFLDWLRSVPKHRDLPVIVASAYARDEPPRSADRTLAKPFRPELLERELRQLALDA